MLWRSWLVAAVVVVVVVVVLALVMCDCELCVITARDYLQHLPTIAVYRCY
jgi:hypothetical protein